MTKKPQVSETVYQYDYSRRAWVKASKRYAAFVAKDVPVVLLGEFDMGEWDYQCFRPQNHQRMMWCVEHKRFEKVHHIERIDSIRSVDGCREHGTVAFFSFVLPPIDCRLTVPYRWQVLQFEDGIVEARADALRFCLTYTGDNEYKDAYAEKYVLHPRRITLTETFDMQKCRTAFCNKRRDWAYFGIDIPTEVTKKIFAYLTKYAPASYTPLPESITDGVKKLRSFVKRPKDFHIEYWRDFFSATEFRVAFPPAQGDNFCALCHALRLTPTENLRVAYDKNPYAPLWEKLLRFWGFKNDKAISLFYELKDFAGMRLPHFRFDRNKNELTVNGLTGWIKGDIPDPEFLEDTETVTADEAQRRFAMLRFYVTWALSENKEYAFAKALYALATKPWPHDLHEELELFYWRFRSYCHYAFSGKGDNPWAEITADVERLSVMTRHHLLGFNTEWFGWHWQVEHERLIEEFNCLEKPSKAIEERKPKKKISRLERILKIYDAMLTNIPPLIPIKRDEYPPSMWRRDLKILQTFDPSLWVDRLGNAHRKSRYSLQGEFPPLPDDERHTRLLAYRLFLADCGRITAELAEKIVDKKFSRRTFVRDLEFLRETCACGRLIYQAAEKIYVWESFGNAIEEGEENDSH